ncbi:MAG: protein translocase subunit SecD [Solirubrobacteraceae bacterium]|nr:protein translocase subunit SecD [Solirubrobacteraceae bacterium]
MTDRRRNLFILLFVAGLLVLSGLVIATKPTVLGLDLKGGVSLVYQAKPTKQAQVTTESVDQTIDIMRKRIDTLGVAEPEIQRTGADQIDVSLPNVTNADQAAAQVGKTAQLYFYDWETNVLGPGCKPAPTDAAVTGGSSAGSGQGSLTQYAAVERAASCPKTDSGKETTTGSYYLVNDKTKKVLAGPQETSSDLDAEIENNKIVQSADTSVVAVEPGTIVVQAEGPTTGAASDQYYVLKDNPALSGTDITDPKQSFANGAGGSGAPTVNFSFTDKGVQAWQETTREIAQRGQDSFFGGDASSAFQHFAIVLDGKLISAPYIDFQQNPDGIDGSNGSEISGGFTIKTAQELANLLKTGALPIKLDLISASSVSASLGKQALDQGIIAGLIGFALVSLFLLVIYRGLGLVAIGALGVYAAFLFAIVKLIPITLTLPGIAGLILTIGVAADANIVIFERVKEEVRLGRSIPVAISQGYRKGLSAIIDANVVTFMVAFILFMLATAGVKGFAFTLGVGTLVSFLTAVLLTQAVLGTLARSKAVSSPAMLGAHSKRQRFRWDFMGASKWFFSFSGLILLIGALAVGVNGLNLGIDFTSGTRLVAELPTKATEQQVRDTIAPLGLSKAKIQKLSGNEFKGEAAFQISTDTVETGQRASIEASLNKEFGTGSYSFQTIGPTFGKTVADSAIIAIIASLIVISAYIALRFEWRYAVPVLVALGHDLLITAGVYALLGLEVTTATVAALLTILGYSLYDTIIVFDRVRENVPRMPRAAFSQILNRSMSEVLMRSLATSFCTVLPILALLFFGGETLADFALALAVGVISGTYSSIFIATPVLMHWKEGEGVWRSRRARIAAANGGVVPPYATAAGGAETEIEIDEPKKPRDRLTAPEDPERAVSGAEFDEMVRDLHGEQGAVATEEDAPETVVAEGDMAEEVEPAEPPAASSGADASPEDLVLKDDPSKPTTPRRKRNKKHGRR